MPDKEEFINYYVQSLQKEVEEAAKQKVVAIATTTFKDAEIGELKETLTKQQEEITEQAQLNLVSKNSLLNEKDMDIQLLRDKNVSLAEKIDTLHRQGKDKETIISEREDTIASLNEQLNSNKDMIDSLNKKLNAKPSKPKVELMNKKKRVRSKIDVYTS
jgi:chromosome segregation ATPase